jgi:hypothetical protein
VIVDSLSLFLAIAHRVVALHAVVAPTFQHYQKTSFFEQVKKYVDGEKIVIQP